MDEKQVAVHRGPSPGREWREVSRGLHRAKGADDEFLADLQTWQQLLRPAAAFTHLTSARFRGWWLPPLPADLPVFISMSSAQNAPSRTGLSVNRHIVPPPSELLAGLRIASAEETLLACADDLGDLDTTVLVEAAVRAGDASLESISELARMQRRGAPRLRRSVRLARPGAESLWECMLRIFHELMGAQVEAQHEVFDREGQFVARGDLWLVGTRMLHEYDGAHHLDRARQRKDLGRARRLGHAEWERRGYTSEDLLRQAPGILRDIDATLGRPHRPDRVRAWNALLRDSLFTASGTARLRRRLGLDLPG